MVTKSHEPGSIELQAAVFWVGPVSGFLAASSFRCGIRLWRVKWAGAVAGGTWTSCVDQACIDMTFRKPSCSPVTDNPCRALETFSKLCRALWSKAFPMGP